MNGKLRTDLKSPVMDKNFGVEIFDSKVPLFFLISLPEVKKAKGFLQCHSDEYTFIEFWTDNEDDILAAWQAIEQTQQRN
jgi:hypothetical protein